ncbi:MAG: tetratricopeptide repeat protein [Niveispirillum sp.]|nr:tetratricopeptide repeat protein [Niveispirillum sp.]
MREITAETFARLLKYRLSRKHRYAFFLGAGCSRSSGIMTASELVRHWIDEHHRHEGTPGTASAWAKGHFNDYDENNPAAHYGKAMDLFFPTPVLRQLEIDWQVGDKNPGYGYATLAALLAHKDLGPQCNVVLTTNFDNLVADALYLFHRRRPLVITHGSLSGFARLTSEKPLVVKLHGDAHFSPQNTKDETNCLDYQLESLFARLIQERGIIFMGYGANDESITNTLRKLSANHVQLGIFWVNDTWPTNEFGDWLESQKAVWVKHLDFDEVMFLIGEELTLPKVDSQRFDEIVQNHEEKFKNLFESIGKKAQQPSATKTDRALADRAQKSTKGDTSPSALHRQAYLLPRGPIRTAALRDAVKKNEDSALLLGALAAELVEFREQPDEAEQLYRRAIDADPNNAIYLGNFANFLRRTRKRDDEAEQFYRRAVESNPNYAVHLGNLASFLADVRKQYDEAEQLFRRAVEVDPHYATHLGNFASFLTDVRKQHDEAEQFYRRALEADPNNAIHLGNFAIFLSEVRKQHDAAEQFYQRAIEADPNYSVHLGNFATFLDHIQKKHEEAENYYRRAVKADPSNPNIMGNLARLLFATGRSDEAIALLDQATASVRAETDSAVLLELLFYRLAHDHRIEPTVALREVRARLLAGHRSPGWDLTANVERAREDGHPFPDLLAAIAKVIADGEPLSSLDSFPEWLESGVEDGTGPG